MRSRTFLAVAVFLVVLLGACVGVYAYDKSKAHTIAQGVTVAEVPVGGLKAGQARARLEQRLLSRIRRPVVVRLGQRRFVLTAKQAKLRTDIDATIDDALDRSRQGNILTRTSRNLRGAKLDLNLEPNISYSNAAVRSLVRHVAAAAQSPVEEADVAFSGAGVSTKKGHAGHQLQSARLRADVEAALGARTAPHRIVARLRTVDPKTSTAEVAKRYPVVLTLDRSAFKLNLFKNLKLVKSYTVAVGQVGLETPAGLYHIQNKQVDPSWHVPNSPWAGKLAGQVIPPGPDDPIKARWMGIFAGAGIHGTDETYSLGQAASHGCVRMAIPDVIELYPQVPVGTPIYIA
ncbi:MAG TPA: L,D-transpeptidase family protein [Solirubrobacteraceae bacterium]